MFRACISAGVLFVLTAQPVPAWTIGNTELVDVNSNEKQSNRGGNNPDLSINGNIVAFISSSRNLDPRPGNGAVDVFVRDRSRGTTRRVSVATGGAAGNENSVAPAVSGLGRYVTFGSAASNLVPNDHNDDFDVFIHDRRTGKTDRISVSASGAEANGRSIESDISRLGWHVAFASDASNLVSGDSNGKGDIFLRNRRTGSVARVSVSTGGQQANGNSFVPSLSSNGRYVAFASDATNLVPNDTNGLIDIFVHDTRLHRTSRVSVGPGGVQADGASSELEISGNGRFVTFASGATNLVPNDKNGIQDVFVHDRATGITSLVSDVGVDGIRGSDDPSISDDGRYVAFSTTSDGPDFTLKVGIFVADRKTGARSLASVNDLGEEADGQSYLPSMAGGGRSLGFFSFASNLVPDDTYTAGGDVFVRDR